MVKIKTIRLTNPVFYYIMVYIEMQEALTELFLNFSVFEPLGNLGGKQT